MTGDSAERVRVLVMDFTAQRISARRSDFGGRDAIAQRIGRTIERVVHSERAEHSIGEENIETLSRDLLDDHPENVSAEIGVDVRRVGPVLERSLENHVAGLLRAARSSPEIAAGGKSGAVREELADGHFVLEPTRERREIAEDGGVEVDFLFVVQDHDGRRGSDDFAEGRDVVDGAVRVDGSTHVGPGETAEALLPYGRTFPSDYDCSARVSTSLDTTLHNAVDRFEAGCRHTYSIRGLGRQTVATVSQRERGHNYLQQIELLSC